MIRLLRDEIPGAHRYRVSCPLFTVSVDTDADGTIIDTAPIVRRFVGQKLARLIQWSKKFGTVEWEEL